MIWALGAALCPWYSFSFLSETGPYSLGQADLQSVIDPPASASPVVGLWV